MHKVCVCVFVRNSYDSFFRKTNVIEPDLLRKLCSIDPQHKRIMYLLLRCPGFGELCGQQEDDNVCLVCMIPKLLESRLYIRTLVLC